MTSLKPVLAAVNQAVLCCCSGVSSNPEFGTAVVDCFAKKPKTPHISMSLSSCHWGIDPRSRVTHLTMMNVKFQFLSPPWIGQTIE